jgi:hypothetical protein
MQAAVAAVKMQQAAEHPQAAMAAVVLVQMWPMVLAQLVQLTQAAAVVLVQIPQLALQVAQADLEL